MESEKMESTFRVNTEKTRVELEAVRLEWHEHTWLCNSHQNHQCERQDLRRPITRLIQGWDLARQTK